MSREVSRNASPHSNLLTTLGQFPSRLANLQQNLWKTLWKSALFTAL